MSATCRRPSPHERCSPSWVFAHQSVRQRPGGLVSTRTASFEKRGLCDSVDCTSIVIRRLASEHGSNCQRQAGSSIPHLLADDIAYRG